MIFIPTTMHQFALNIQKLLILSFLVCIPLNVFAKTSQEVQFKDITITTSNTHLLLFGVVHNSNQKELTEALYSGIPMQFTFYVELLRTRSNWPDEKLVSMEFNHILKYDPLKENFQLEIEERKNRIYTFATLDKAMTTMNDINGLKVIELSKLLPDNSYELRMKAILFKKTLPMNLHYIVPFISMWDMETDWVTIEFTY